MDDKGRDNNGKCYVVEGEELSQTKVRRRSDLHQGVQDDDALWVKVKDGCSAKCMIMPMIPIVLCLVSNLVDIFESSRANPQCPNQKGSAQISS